MLITVIVSCFCLWCLYFFFFKQKTAYEMRISDWSSDVCSSDLLEAGARAGRRFLEDQGDLLAGELRLLVAAVLRFLQRRSQPQEVADQIGRASCRDRVCQYV